MKTAVDIADALDRAGVTLRREFAGKFGPSDPGCSMPEMLRELGLIEMVGLKNSKVRIRATNAELTEFDWITNLVRAVIHGDERLPDRMLLWRKAGMLRDERGKWIDRKQKAIARDLGVHRHTVRHRLTALYVELSNSTKLIVRIRHIPTEQVAA